jgi:undecaprenyl diphosphate synthase
MKDYNNIPNHIAIVMDGNRRWAKSHNLPVLEGHRRVVTGVLEKLIAHASKRGVKYLTLWAWSTENWKRDEGEVKGIMNLLRWGFGKFGQKMHKNGIQIRVIGDMRKLDPDIQKSISDLITLTKNNSRITVTFALNYGGRDELLRAIQNLQIYKSTNKQIIEKISEKEFSQFLDTKDIPDPDLIIRTGGEQRLSGFLLWQCQYSELLFVPWYMPDFTSLKLDEAIEEYTLRQRRFGN